MEQQLCQFSMEHALELVMVFDNTGKITYANESARKQLEYGEELCGSFYLGHFSRESSAMRRGSSTRIIRLAPGS